MTRGDDLRAISDPPCPIRPRQYDATRSKGRPYSTPDQRAQMQSTTAVVRRPVLIRAALPADRKTELRSSSSRHARFIALDRKQDPIIRISSILDGVRLVLDAAAEHPQA